MGEFLVRSPLAPGRVFLTRARNFLMYRAHARLFAAIFPGNSAGPFTFKIGFSGPMQRWPEGRPDSVGGDGPYTLDRRGKLSDFIAGSWSGDGCARTQNVREFLGYERKTITDWTLTDDQYGLILDSGWYEFRSRLTWARHGDWAPSSWRDYPQVGDPLTYVYDGTYHQPHPYINCPPWQGQHGYPWCIPRELLAWYRNQGPPMHCIDPVTGGELSYGDEETCEANGGAWVRALHPDNLNPFGFDCYDCESAPQLVGWKAGCVYVTITDGINGEEVLAAANLAIPVMWRAGPTTGAPISVSYRGRLAV